MVSETIVYACPACGLTEPVIRHGTNRGGTMRLRCKACLKTFTPKPNPRRVTPEMEERIWQALQERIAVTAIARMLHVSTATIYKVLKKNESTTASGADPGRTAP
jgi:transposase-like protein